MLINGAEDPVNRSCMQLLLVIIMAYLVYNYALNSAKDVVGIKYGLNIAESLAVDKYLTHFLCVFSTIVGIFLVLLLAFGKSILIERVYCCAVLDRIMRCLVGFYNDHGPLWDNVFYPSLKNSLTPFQFIALFKTTPIVPQTLSKRKKITFLELVIIIAEKVYLPQNWKNILFYIVQFDYFANLLINITLLQIYICNFYFHRKNNIENKVLKKMTQMFNIWE